MFANKPYKYDLNTYPITLTILSYNNLKIHIFLLNQKLDQQNPYVFQPMSINLMEQCQAKMLKFVHSSILVGQVERYYTKYIQSIVVDNSISNWASSFCAHCRKEQTIHP
jgi:hypothetical protein